MFKSEPFTSSTFTVSEDGFPVGNRPVYSDSDRHFRKMCLSDGVPYSPPTNLAVSAVGGMDVSVAAGDLIKNGAHGWLTASKTISLTTSTSDQVIYIGVRLAADDAYFVGDDVAAYTTFVEATDLALARIDIPANSTAITAGMLTDLRGNRAYCGYNTDLRTQAEEALSAIEGTGIVPHAGDHEAGGSDPIDIDACNGVQYVSQTLTSEEQTQVRTNISAAKAVSGVLDAIEAAVVINPKTDSYTVALSDVGKDIWITKATAATLTIPLQSSVAFVDKSYFFVTRGGAGSLTIAGASGVTVNSAGSRLKIAEQYGTVMVRRTAENVWLVTGSTSA
ncbi:MAG: hypothetical protein VB062_04565 [Christensenella sp.]|nr:hypothetical protein [Christensenella sp.]